VRGIVQGVGFRPYIHALAHRHQLTGFVQNGAAGVVIEIEGTYSSLEAFTAELPQQLPPLAQIVDLTRTAVPLAHSTSFEIHESLAAADAFTLIPPDISICDACLAEIHDPTDRRFGYPFTNCTHCGPRYSIICDIPYDRALTTMAEFAMCPACSAEYHDTASRRFHAQPNACALCGPQLQLVINGVASSNSSTQAILRSVCTFLQAGGTVAWKGLGGYQLACDARNQQAVEELRRRKRRSEKPFAIMVADAAVAESLCLVSSAERIVLESRERPIVLLHRRPNSGLAEAVSPGNPATGVMLPCTPMHDLLFCALQQHMPNPALVMTSGNLSEEPIVIDAAAAEVQLAPIADAFVHHNRRIHTRVDDSIVRVVDEAPMLLRRARGYAPQPIWIGGTEEVLATGAQQKSTFCLARNGFALPSQHLGDLENYETLEFYEETLDRMQRLFHIRPKTVAHDLHPGYLSTQLALKMQDVRHIGVQHHHAHIASCMAEHGLTGQVIGIAFDGTGLGTDGKIWGGEFLAASLTGFERYAHLRYIPLPGGDTAVREPWRIARSYLRDAFDGKPPQTPSAIPAETLRLVDAMLDQNLHTVDTSSCGRLFDAVASLLGLHHTVSFEGQAAMALEATAAPDHTSRYDFSLLGEAPIQVDLHPMIQQIMQDLAHGIDSAVISARFHNTLVAVVAEVCSHMENHFGLTRICLSGGCFQNIRLLHGCMQTLHTAGFEVFHQRKVPANDGGISLGQAAIACEMLRQGL
jgi:hydrogenase maturation protein HypF